MTKQKKSKNYIEPADFFDEVLWCMKKEQCSERLGRIFLLVSEKAANHPRVVRYPHIREDLISVGATACVAGFMKFRPNKNILERNEEGEIIKSTPVPWDGEIVEYDYRIHNNPHAFFSKCIENATLQYLKNHYYRDKNIVNKLKIENGMEPDHGYEDVVAREKERKAERKAKREKEKQDENEYIDAVDQIRIITGLD